MYDEHRDAVHTMVRRGYLTSLDDSGEQQLVNLSRFVRDTPQKVVRVQHAGLTSTPSYGEGLVIGMGGRSDNIWALGLENPGKRVKGLPAGSTAIYDESGNVIRLVGKQTTFAFDGADWSATSKSCTVTCKGGAITIDPGGSVVQLGGPAGGSFHRVATDAGFSSKVLAAL